MVVRFLMLAGVLVGTGLAIAGAMLGTRASASFDHIEIWAWIMLASFALADVLLRANIISGSPAAVSRAGSGCCAQSRSSRRLPRS
jgi:hypothetical protein